MLRAEGVCRAEPAYCQGQGAFGGGDYDRAPGASNGPWSFGRIGRWPSMPSDGVISAWVHLVINVAGVYLQAQRYDEAKRFYRQALGLAPTKVLIHHSSGRRAYF